MQPSSSNNSDQKLDYYQKFIQTKDKMLDHALAKVQSIKKNARQIGDVIDEHDQHLDQLNNRLSNIQRKAEKTQMTMQRYLQRTGDCKLYIILGIQIFLFIILMSI